MKRYRNKGIDKVMLFGPANPAGCAICGEDEPSVLGIHEADDSHEFKVLCSKCYSAPGRSFDSNLQKQIGGGNV